MKREDAKDLIRGDKDSYGKPKSIMTKIDRIYDDFEKEKEAMIKAVQDWRDEQAKQLEEDTKGMTSIERIQGIWSIAPIENKIAGLDIALRILNKNK
jgi:hypothetical protein